MATYQPQTIRKTLEDIMSGKLIIPALQRNFVWPESKITDLFDSLVRGYPIGTFLFWDVNDKAFSGYSFNKILTTFKESRNKKYRGEAADGNRTEYCAVLDGQQRITSLAIGILGKYIVHKKGYLWDSDSSFVEKYLCVNILHEPQDNDDKYEFKFMSLSETDQIIPVENNDGDVPVVEYKYWLRVSEIYSEQGVFNEANGGLFGFCAKLEALDSTVFSLQKRMFINKLLMNVHSTLREKEVVSVYTTPNDLPLDKIVDIFVRVNSGGQKLDDADLILSIASGDNADESFYDKIANVIDDIQSATKKEFRCDKKFILSVALLFTGASTLSLKHSENYSRESVNKITDAWDTIIDKIKAALIFVEKLGFDVSKLSSSVIIPIAYYFKLSDRSASYFDKVSSAKDRVYIRQWIFRTVINGVFDEGTGKTLIRMRTLIDEAHKQEECFPLDKFYEKAIKKPLLISNDQIEDILDWRWPDYRIVPLLMEISPSIPNGDYSMDHMWPRVFLTTKKKLEAATPNLSNTEREQIRSRADFLPNIQLLTGNENSQKNKQFFESWITEYYSDSSKRMALFDRNIVPVIDDYSFEAFNNFFEKRSALLQQRIRDAFPDTVEALDKRHGF